LELILAINTTANILAFKGKTMGHHYYENTQKVFYDFFGTF